MKKIFISGPSGSGKTTLAKYIAARYRIPFVNGSSKVLWKQYGITSHSDLITKCNNDPEMAIKFQFELLEYRNENLTGKSEFVTDRSPLDNLVYYLLQVSHLQNTETTKEFVIACSDVMHRFDFHQIYLDIRHTPYQLENDGMRVHNEYYQNMVDSIFKDLINNEILFPKQKAFIINEWGWESRVRAVESLLKPKTPSLWRQLKIKYGL